MFSIEPVDLIMAHPIHWVEGFDIVAPYTVRILFEDRTEQAIDFEPVLRGELFGPLRNLTLFNRLQLDPEAHTLLWPNGADFDPAILHDWPSCKDAFIDMAARWEYFAI